MFRKFILRLVILSFIFPAIAFGVSSNAFNVKKANDMLSALEGKFSVQKLSAEYLSHSIDVLMGLQGKAKTCVKTAQMNADEIKALQKEILPISEESLGEELTDTQKYLKEKKNLFSQRALDCRLFILRSNDLIAEMGVEIQRLRAKKLLRVGTPFLDQLRAGTRLAADVGEKFDTSIFMKELGITPLGHPISWVLLGTVLLLTIILCIYGQKHLTKRILALKKESEDHFFYFAWMDTIKRYLFFITIPAIFSLIFGLLDMMSRQLTGLTSISISFLGCALFLMFCHFFFYAFDRQNTISGISVRIARSLLLRLQWFVGLVFGGLLLYVLFRHQPLSKAAIDLVWAVFITLLNISLVNILWLVNRIRVLQSHRLITLTLSLLFTIVLLTLVTMEWMGYQPLVAYILQGVFLTLIFGFITYLILRLIKIVLQTSEQVRISWYGSLRSYLGVEPKESLFEFVLLRFLVDILIWIGFIIILLRIWRLHRTHFRMLMDVLVNGFSFYGLMIIPLRILSALLCLSVGLLIVRWIKARFERSKKRNITRGAQAAIAAIMGYIGIIFVFICSLLIAGVNLAGFAIVAGALSVGIGFGLQNIVNNFVSGIILLIERPIKPGDRVLINDIEGFVRKIHIRSTRIRTLAQTDLIVPNSQMVSGQLINLTFRDAYAKVPVVVKVAYGTDTALVEKVLLGVCDAHEQVIKDDPNYEPSVFCTDFGEDGLKFELYCTVSDVAVRYRTLSDLCLAIDQAFRKHGIQFAFPHRDIRIREGGYRIKNDI